MASDFGTNLQFRAEFFNVWNHTQWIGNQSLGGISRTAKFTKTGELDTTSDFGQVTGAYDPRTVQLALKLTF